MWQFGNATYLFISALGSALIKIVSGSTATVLSLLLQPQDQIDVLVVLHRIVKNIQRYASKNSETPSLCGSQDPDVVLCSPNQSTKQNSNGVRFDLSRFLMTSKNLLLVLDLVSVPKKSSLAVQR